MNILIFDSTREGRLTAPQCLADRFKVVVCVGGLRQFFTLVPPQEPMLGKFNALVFLISGIRVRRRDRAVIPTSKRAAEILQVARAAAHEHIPCVIVASKSCPVAFYKRETYEPVPAESALSRPLDATNNFSGYFVSRDWEQIASVIQ
ncbi:MAG: hypothetical protein Q7R93_04905 [bacterium]|nr:hypothetical protein [bacterium]